MTSLRDFAISATKRYLQSIVFVDDEIYSTPTGKPREASIDLPKFSSPFAVKPKQSHPATVEMDSIEEAAASLEEVENAGYHPKHLVESFAREGMVCALYEPQRGFETDPNSELFKLCERADVVILDWDLYQEDGRNVVPLLANLVNQSENSIPHQVRLCAIYTTKPDLGHVTSTIFDALAKQELPIQAESSTRLHVGSAKIIVLGKPQSTGRSAELRESSEVAERDLAARIIEEFAGLHHGMLPSAALHNMSTIRMNSKKILDKFRKDMDSPFLLHRALILHSEEAFDQIPELVAEEALAVMIDDPIASNVIDSIASDHADAIDLSSLAPWQQKQGRPAPQPGELPRRWLIGGREAVEEDYSIPRKGIDVSAFHAAFGCNDSSADKQLAALFDLRTQYSDRKTLTFGTIVSWTVDNSRKYAVCMMPLCDSLRLDRTGTQVYQFPFWTLKESSGGGIAKGFVTQIDGNNYVELFACGKPRDNLWLAGFRSSNSGIVIASLSGGKYEFQGEDRSLEWLGQLKPSHAQRIAQDIGQSMSRVAVVEAEWLRLKTDKS